MKEGDDGQVRRRRGLPKAGDELLGRDLGGGLQGKVIQVENRKTGELFAAKVFTEEAYMRREYMMMTKVIGCSGAAQLVCVIKEKPGGRLFGSLIMKLYGQSLKHQLISLKTRRMSERDVATIVKKLAESLQQIHSRGVVHRDLKLENIFTERGLEKGVDDLVIGDFGVATDDAREMPQYCGTSKYMAPEIFALKGSKADGNINNPASVDVWGLGIMAYELLGSKPDEKLRDSGEFRWPHHISRDAKHLVSLMLEQDPNKRCTMDSVLKHRWIVEHTKAPKEDVLPTRNCDSKVVSSGPGWSCMPTTTVKAH